MSEEVYNGRLCIYKRRIESVCKQRPMCDLTISQRVELIECLVWSLFTADMHDEETPDDQTEAFYWRMKHDWRPKHAERFDEREKLSGIVVVSKLNKRKNY